MRDRKDSRNLPFYVCSGILKVEERCYEKRESQCGTEKQGRNNSRNKKAYSIETRDLYLYPIIPVIVLIHRKLNTNDLRRNKASE